MTEILDPGVETDNAQLSLSTRAARKLATTTKTVPQMQSITPRWLLRKLPWEQVDGGTYRVNRRLTYAVGGGRVAFTNVGAHIQLIPETLGELPLYRGFEDIDVFRALADRLEQREYEPGEVIVAAGRPSDAGYIIARGKAHTVVTGKYGDESTTGLLADGEYFGQQLLQETPPPWAYTVRAVTRCIVLELSAQRAGEVISRSPALREHIQRLRDSGQLAQNKRGEASIAMSAGHTGEPDLPGTFVGYDAAPREYELSVAQTVLRVHSRVADLYNKPMNQTEQQLRLTVEALRERQEHELVNNREFGLLHNADLATRIRTRTGPPTPDDMDNLLARRRKTAFYLAHPKAIAAFRRECTKCGLYPATIDVEGRQLQAWRGTPILPCDKIPVTAQNTTSILAMRIGLKDEGVIGLRHAGLPDEYQPGLSVRFMGINDKAVISYLVSTYYSVAVLVPDALGVLEDIELGS